MNKNPSGIITGIMIFNHFLIKAIENPPTKMTDSKINVMSNVVDRFGSITTRKRGRAHKRASLSSTFHSMRSSSCSCMYTATNIIIIILVSSDGCSLVNPRLIHLCAPFTLTPTSFTRTRSTILIIYKTLLKPHTKLKFTTDKTNITPVQNISPTSCLLV